MLREATAALPREQVLDRPTSAPPMAVEVERLVKHFPITKGVLRRRQIGLVRAVDGIDFSVRSGGTLAIVGESGCGKTTTARMLLGLEQPTSGRIDLADAPARGNAGRHVQTVFQDPYSSLNPRLSVRDIIGEPLRAMAGLDKTKIEERVLGALDAVGLERAARDRYPHMFSGGQRQRIAIARAIVSRPTLIVLDEPVSALDVSIRAQILNLLKDFQDEMGVAYVMITHDLATVRFIAQTIAVMYRGRFVEHGEAGAILARPRHPYTRSLVAAARLQRAVDRDNALGTLPETVEGHDRCPLHSVCALATAACRSELPELRAVDDRLVACHHAENS